MRAKWLNFLVLVALVLGLMPFVSSQTPVAAAETEEPGGPIAPHALFEDDAEEVDPPMSHRLIVELESPSLAVWGQAVPALMKAGGKLDVASPSAQMYIARLQAEQLTFQIAMRTALPQVKPSTYVNEFGATEVADYQIAFNGLSVDPGTMDPAKAQRALEGLPGVKRVYRDYAYTTDLYTSTYLINAPELWTQLGGQANAGAGVKIASMDGGAHHAAPMFSGEGFAYPADYPAAGLGFTANNNGKIIASRVYFREWDPPATGEANPWPGTSGTSHGTHTSSTAGGNLVTDATYSGAALPPVSGVAPGAWIMSYRVFYNSVTNDGSFYTVEGLAALDDIVADGADVLNNSWGGGPGSIGGEFDALDTALINVAKAGIFVTMSNGNAGPGLGTGDHPSSDYINVAASTTGGTYLSGVFSVIAPEPITTTLQDIAYADAGFGGTFPIGSVITYTYLAAANIGDGTNFIGCNPFPAGTFTGKAAVISRGTCNFDLKVLNAQQAGAEFVVVYNHASGGDALVSMGAVDLGDQVTIPSIFIGNTAGQAMVAKQAEAAAASQAAVLEMDMTAYQAGNTPDIIASFSSRGPSAAMTLKPDIAAPGVNILAQGYTPGTTGEDRHLGYGQVSGTSMAAPHVTGAAALLRSIHPEWSNAYIKSALMSTAVYTNVFNQDGSPAQPLDMGGGRMDLTQAAAPGVILDPPSLSFGLVPTGTTTSIQVNLTSVAEGGQTYHFSTLYTGNGFDAMEALPGVTVEPISVTLLPGATAMITVTFDPATSMGIGDNQGYIVMDASVHDAHMALWARVMPEPAEADVLIIDASLGGLVFDDYLAYYTDALTELGMTYDVWFNFGVDPTVPDPAVLMSYDVVLLFTGDNYHPNGYYTIATPLTQRDMNALTEYANAGGTLIAMGQDLAAVMGSDNPDGGSFFYNAVLGGSWLQDSVTGSGGPDRRIVPHPVAPPALKGMEIDISVPTFYNSVLAGYNEVPPVATATSGEISYAYNPDTNTFRYVLSVAASDRISITAAHIHSGTVSVNGPVLAPIFPFTETQVVTETQTWSGSVAFTPEMLGLYQAGKLYVNVHTEDHPAGEIRAQLVPHFLKDGAGNQWYIDEIEAITSQGYAPFLVYPGPYNQEVGVVGMAHREQPTLENPGISYLGRSIYTTFGLEGVNDTGNSISRAGLLSSILTWAADEPEVVINNVTPDNQSGLSIFKAQLTSNVEDVEGISFRWDFGDGRAYSERLTSPDVSHTYTRCGTYTVRVEAMDSWGNNVVGSQQVDVDACLQRIIYMPILLTGAAAP